MAEYTCECGEHFNDPQKFNGHKSHCSIHLQAIGKEYSMQDRMNKQTQTIIDKYGSLENYSNQHSEAIKASLKGKTIFDKLITEINKDEFIHDYIELNMPRKSLMSKYHITSDYMFDKLVKYYNCKKGTKNRAKLMIETKRENYPPDNFNNWQQGHLTRIEHCGSLEESYKQTYEKVKQTTLEKYGTECLFNSSMIITHRKKKETEPNKKFANLLLANHIEFEQEFVLENKSFDFKVNNILIEINPTATHNSIKLPYPPYKGKESNYHSLKSKLAEKYGYRCIHIWDWDDINKIINLLILRPKIGARQCIVKEINAWEANNYLDQYHLQGKARSQYQLGLFFNNELVSVMTFGKPRYHSKYEWELIRYCAHYQVIGGVEKLFNFFIEQQNPKSIISYCDRSKFLGNIYLKLGFKFQKISISKHWYHQGKKIHITSALLQQRGFDQLLGNIFKCYGKGTNNEELMIQHGFLSVYDAGQASYIWIAK